jgi:hypothetical protein
LYKLGTAWYRNIATNFPVKVGTTYIQWNQDVSGTWQLTEAGTGNYIAMWILATNDVEEPVMSLMGQTVSNSLLAAQTDNQFSLLNIAGIPFAEFRPLYRLIFETNTTYTNTVKAILVDVVNIQVSPTIQLTQAVTNGTVTSVTVDGGTTGLTTSGNPITTTGTITLAGTVNTSHGGTGLTALGTASQILGVNTGSTALEYIQ